MHLGLKRNFQVMPGTQWLELLCRHIPDRYEHLVRYVGWYSNRARGERAKAQKTQDAPGLGASPIKPVSEPASAFAAHARSAWARLIRKVYEADPLECQKCHGPMRIIALIDDPPVVRRILDQRTTPFPTSRKRREARGCPAAGLALCAGITSSQSAGFCTVSGSPTLPIVRYRGQTTPELDAVRSSFGSYDPRLPGAPEKSGIDLAICLFGR